MTDEEELYQAYYQPDRLWTGGKAIRRLHKIMFMSKEDIKSRLAKQALWQVHMPLPKEIHHPHYDVTKPNKQRQFEIMITASMLKKQVWMADDDEFDHIVKNSNRVLKLTNAEEFTKGCNVMFVYGTYILEGEADAKFSLGDIWNLFQGDTLPNNASNFCRQPINCMKAWNYLQETLDLPLSTEIIKQAHGLMMEDEKDVLAGEYRKSCICRLSYF